MGKETDELRKLFDRRLEEAGTTVFYGKVTATAEAARTCTVEIDGIPYENVLLYAIEKPELKGFAFIPAVDSQVLVKRIGDDRYCVEMFSVIDKVLLSIGEKVTATLDAETLSYKNDKVSLTITGTKAELTADEIVLNGGGLGGLVQIADITAKLNDLVKTFNSHTHSNVVIQVTGQATGTLGPSGKPDQSADTFSQADYENPKVKH